MLMEVLQCQEQIAGNLLQPVMSRTTQILAFSAPPTVAKEVETLAKQERRPKSELFREMVRVYERYHAQRDSDEQRWVENLIAEAKSRAVRASGECRADAQ